MSLINQMLQDLDKRQAGDTAQRGEFAAEVRAVAAPDKSALPWKSLLAVLLLAGAALLWWLLRQPEPVAAPKAAVPQPAMSPAAAVTPAPAQPLLPTLKADTELDWTPQPAKAHEPGHPEFARPATVEAASAAIPATAPAPKAQAEPRPVKAAELPGAVEKREKELSPQQRAENSYRQAISLLQQGRVVEAVDSLQQAIKLDPQHLSARQTLAALLVEAKRPAEAEQVLQEGLKLNPEQSGFAMVLSRLQAGRGDNPAALETLRRGLPYAADKAEYHALYAALLQRQDKHVEAIEQYQAALRKSPSAGVWLMGLGISLQAEKRNQEAVEVFTRAKASGNLSAELKAFVEQRLKQLQ